MISEEDLKSEKKYLANVVKVIEGDLTTINNALFEGEKNLDATSKYMADNFYDMDAEEQAVAKQALEQLQLNFLELTHLRDLRERQKESAYFGRVDFKANDEKDVHAHYIGIAHILAKDKELPLVLDWRAPLSSIYYDYELGKASYFAPMGEIEGMITLKRQYKTVGKKLEYAFDSDITINDDILKAELGKGASAKMKNIVATIQAEQNKIIRADENTSIVVQGVAGSGKTSIALHRLAYLIYKNHLKAKDLLIVSPSSLFSDYISNVLPELGEENSPKITFDEIANEELKTIARFEPKSQMLEDIVLGNVKRAKSVQQKNTFAFFEALKKYLDKKISVSFKAQDIAVGKSKIKASEISALYNEKYSSKAPAVRIEWIGDYIIDKLEIGKAHEKAVFARVKKILLGMFENTNLVDIYFDFLKTQKIENYSVKIGKDVFVGYEDMPALLYIKDYLLGVEVHKEFKHVFIDEMQDYSPIAIALLQKIYPATKTVLGDVNQMFEKNAENGYLKKIAELLDNAKVLTLNTTYRSTLQIAKHNQKLIGLKNVHNFNREGKDVEFVEEKNFNKCVNSLAKKYASVAIITPSIKEANNIFEKLGEDSGFAEIGDASGKIKDQKVVIPAVFSKGLEFDAVIFVESKTSGAEDVQKNIKYIACTRALHELYIFRLSAEPADSYKLY